ncbi:hypothetical protein KFL_004600040 [Klebsormidium nitens]|uniref:AB hydrolase-1 domain-containing protein n=1 Tax=Klebsormidium nitens TaxID=105231 RepID=A0A1Y1IDX8_KLENI|nr:hypothetical protein KFL_004600040 [Klebsormidium nitens]|eukprot:GAQ88793.1 hypothetical protein KFL_004600040 [Klebsormidium nitens]
MTFWLNLGFVKSILRHLQLWKAAALVVADASVPKITLPDGRQVAYLEKGCRPSDARHSLLLLHGLGSSRLSNMPGISNETLADYGVRMVAIDRPGYGQSDARPGRTFRSEAHDLARVADALQFPEKFWVLGYSMGGAFAWGAIRYIPERLAGATLWAPVGSLHWPGLTSQERADIWREIPGDSKYTIAYGRHVPRWALDLWAQRVILPNTGDRWVRHGMKRFSPPDKAYLQKPGAAEMLTKDNTEAFRQRSGAPFADDIHTMAGSWGFEPGDLTGFDKPIHIWQGTEDWLVPKGFQRYAKRRLPRLHLHELEGEGHLSWFCHNEANQRKVLESMFGPPISLKTSKI